MYAEGGGGSFPDNISSSDPHSPSHANVGEEDDNTVDPNFLSFLEDDDSDGDGVLPDLYAILGVAKDSSDVEIKAAYRQKSRLVHPDKYTQGNASTGNANSASLLADAETSFGRVVAAYNVLSDPRKRSIYDQFGHKGLRIQGWEVAVREKTAPELRLEYLLLKQKAKETESERILQTTSELCVGIDMTDLFDRYLHEPPMERVYAPMLSVYDLSISQSVTAVRTLRNTFSLAGHVTAHNGIGMGTFLGIWEHRFGPRTPYVGAFVSETLFSYGRGGRGPGISINATKQLNNHVSVCSGLELATSRRDSSLFTIVPGFILGANFQLTSKVSTRLQYRWNLNGGLTADVVWASVLSEQICKVQTRLSDSGHAFLTLRFDSDVDWAWLNPFTVNAFTGRNKSSQQQNEWRASIDEDEDDLLTTGVPQKGRVTISATCSTMDAIEFRVGANCVLSEYSTVSAEMGASWLQGLSLKLGFSRGGQSYVFPFKLSEVWNPAAAGYGFAVPLLTFGVVRNLIYAPWAAAQLQKVQNIRRERLRDELRRLRSQAMATQTLMQHTCTRMANSERTTNGLVVVLALYGRLSPENPAILPKSDIGGPLCIDVTVPLQVFVDNHQIRLPPGNWADQQGFYDPCAGLGQTRGAEGRKNQDQPTRQLYVAYSFNGLPHEVVADEWRGLAIPMSKHRVEAFSKTP